MPTKAADTESLNVRDTNTIKNLWGDSGNMIDTENNKVKCVVWIIPRFSPPNLGNLRNGRRKRKESKGEKARAG